MLEYDEVALILQDTAMMADLKVYQVEPWLNTRELDRRFKMFCVPRSWEPPYKMHAELRFFWDAAQTAYSCYGDEGLCALYHADHEECLHGTYYLAEPFTELEVRYDLSSSLVGHLALADLPSLVQQALEVVEGAVDHPDRLVAELETYHTRSNVHVASARLRQTWLLENDELMDVRLLSDILLDVCQEVYRATTRLARAFQAPEERE